MMVREASVRVVKMAGRFGPIFGVAADANPRPPTFPVSAHQLHTDHARLFDRNRFVYPVLSRRSGGIFFQVSPFTTM